MVFFLIALVLAALGVGAYAYASTGVQDIVVRNYHFTGIPDWMPVAITAGAILFLFLLHAIYASVRIRMLKRGGGRTGSVGSRPMSTISR